MGFDPKLQEYIDDIIRHKASQLARQRESGPSNRGDIEHELFIAILERWPAFDSSRASARTYIARIVESKAASIVRARLAAKRGTRLCTSINRNTGNGPCDFDEEQVRARRGQRSRPALEALWLRMDVASVIGGLPDDLRRLCERLMHESVSDAARSSGRHRTTLYRAIGELRKRFTEAGIHEYR